MLARTIRPRKPHPLILIAVEIALGQKSGVSIHNLPCRVPRLRSSRIERRVTAIPRSLQVIKKCRVARLPNLDSASRTFLKKFNLMPALRLEARLYEKLVKRNAGQRYLGIR